MSKDKDEKLPTNSALLATYGINLPHYLLIKKLQKARCAICGIAEEYLKQRLHLDHDHQTGRIRGLLCRACNHGLGCFKDSIERLYSATAYLRGQKDPDGLLIVPENRPKPRVRQRRPKKALNAVIGPRQGAGDGEVDGTT